MHFLIVQLIEYYTMSYYVIFLKYVNQYVEFLEIDSAEVYIQK